MNNQPQPTSTEVNPESPSQIESQTRRLNLSDVINDKSQDIHQLSFMRVHNAEAVGELCVFDLDHVHASDAALQVIKRAHLMPLFLVEAFALHYRENLRRKLTRGNDKGLFVFDPTASIYFHELPNGNTLVVQANTIEHGAQFVRQLVITTKAVKLEGEHA